MKFYTQRSDGRTEEHQSKPQFETFREVVNATLPKVCGHGKQYARVEADEESLTVFANDQLHPTWTRIREIRWPI